jgi:hypothetical protein
MPTANDTDRAYQNGIMDERKMTIAYLRGQAEELRKMKFDEKARLLVWCAEDLENQRHISSEPR